MTQELAQALVDAIGDELTLLAGQRATRLDAAATTSAVVDYALDVTSSVDSGVTITRASGAWSADVVAGARFYVGSGLHRGRWAVIDSVDSPTQLTLDGAGIGVNFSLQSYWIVSAADTTVSVETTLDWDAAGSALIDGTIYTYSSKTLTSLIGLSSPRLERAWGRIQFVAGASLVDGQTVTITDSQNRTVVFEFDSNAAVTAGRVPVAFTAGDTATQVRDAFMAALNVLDFGVKAFVYDTAILELVQVLAGTAGNTAITETVANAGFVVFGFIDGAATVAGVVRDLPVLTPVVDWSGTYSVADRARRNVQVRHAEGEFLDVLGENLGVPRPYGLDDDDVYRGLIQLLAYGNKGAGPLIAQVLDLVVGVGNWVKFTDGTGAYTQLDNGGTLLTRNTLRNNNIVFFWRDGTEDQAFGKAILGQSVYALPASTTSIVLPENANTVESIKLAPDPLPVRLITSGLDGEITLGPATMTDAALVVTDIFPGDVLEVLSGPNAGERYSISAVGVSSVTLGPVLDLPVYEPPTEAYAQFAWRIVRTVSSFRQNLPSAEQYIEYDGDPGTTIWSAIAAGGASEGANVSLQNDTPANGGRYLRMTATVGQSISYRHTLRSVGASSGEVSALVRPSGTFAAGATDGDQWTIQLRDSVRSLAVGVIATSGTEYELGFINSTTGAFIGAPGYTGDTAVLDWLALRLVKGGDGIVRLWVNDVLVESLPYASFATTADRRLEFGMLTVPTATGQFRIKTLDWQVETPTEFNSVRFTNASTAATDTFTDDAAGGFFAAGDATAPRKTLSIESFGATNASGGNPRGVWEVATFTNANNVDLRGLSRTNGRTFGVDDPSRFDAIGDAMAFRVPDALGANIVITNGPNAGTYAIAEFVDQATGTDLLAPYPGAVALFIAAGGTPPFSLTTGTVRVTPDFPDPSDDTELVWRLEPAFANDAAVTGVLHGASTLAAATITLRQALPYSTPVVQVTYTVVDSAQVLNTGTPNPLVSPGVYTYYPFYLWDAWGYLRGIIAEFLLVAGVEPDFDRLVVDATGYHLL